jgi:hypothetical protein
MLPALRVDRVLDPLSRQRQVAQALAGGIGDRIGDRGGCGALTGFAAAEERLAGTVDDVDVDLSGTASNRRIG